jgi:hypothetical protein
MPHFRAAGVFAKNSQFLHIRQRPQRLSSVAASNRIRDDPRGPKTTVLLLILLLLLILFLLVIFILILLLPSPSETHQEINRPFKPGASHCHSIHLGQR